MLNFKKYLRAHTPILYFNTHDYERIDSLLSKSSSINKIYEYSHAYGTIPLGQKVLKKRTSSLLQDFLDDYKDRGFDKHVALILKNVHKELHDPAVQAILRHIAERTLSTEDYQITICIVSPVLDIPKELEHIVTVVDNLLPTHTEILSLLSSYCSRLCCKKLSGNTRESFATALQGLTTFEIRQILNSAYIANGQLNESDIQFVIENKKQLIKKSGLLELLEVKEQASDIGGLEVLKEWLTAKSCIFKQLEEAQKYGVDTPKGVLILGFPGCGKSLTAKAAANLFSLPLLRLDIGRLMGKYLGQSENNLRSALQLAEAISPCVLWIDEVEKAFAGAQGNGHEVTRRLIGNFLTWMQEKSGAVFTVATANSIDSLPPEFLRKGRFDEVFRVDLPLEHEIESILSIHLIKRGHYDKHFDLTGLARKMEGFSGAEVEAVVALAVEKAFLDGSEQVSFNHLTEAIPLITPLSTIQKEKMEEIHNQLEKNAISLASKKNTDGLNPPIEKTPPLNTHEPFKLEIIRRRRAS